MNWLDGIIGFISPEWGARREAWRQSLTEMRNYDAGNYDRGNANWRVLNQSAEFTDRYSRDNVRARARDLERNSDMMNSVIGAYKRNVIGGGYALQAKTGSDKTNEIIQTAWKKWCKKQNCDEIAAKVSEYNKVLCIVNTRKDAKELYDRLPNDGVKLHLSRMMCPAHLHETIGKIKTLLKDESQPIVRVIATQLVEAGVDIDFPVVFRQEAGLDSVLQAAGRCNREGRSAMGHTFVFSLAAEKRKLFGSMADSNNARLNLPEDSDWFAPSTMKAYFCQLYSRKQTFDEKDIKHWLYKPTELCFETASKEFHLIDDTSINVIINWENSMELIEQLKESGCTYSLVKQLAKFTVGIRSYDFKQLKGYGLVEEILEGIYVLADRSQYNKATGLSLDNHWLEEVLMI